MANVTMEEALEQCWQRLQEGEPLEACVQAFPQYAAELKEILVITMKYATLPQEPSEEFRARSLRRTLVAAQRARQQRRQRRWWSLSMPAMRWAAASATALFLLFAGGEFAWATADSLPGTPLYSVKEAREQASIILTNGQPAPRAAVQTDLTERRINELQRMVESPEYLPRVPAVLLKMEQQLNQAIEAIARAKNPDRRALVLRLIQVMSRADQQLRTLEQNPRTQAMPEVQRMRQWLDALTARVRSMLPAVGEQRPARQRAAATSSGSPRSAVPATASTIARQKRYNRRTPTQGGASAPASL